MSNDVAIVNIMNNIRRPESSLSEGINIGHWDRFFTVEGLHPFNTVEWKRVDARIISDKGEIKFEQRNVEVPSWWNQTTTNIVVEKYFRVINEIREDSVKQMLSRVASCLREWGEEQGYFDTNSDAEIYEDELIYAMLHQFGSFNSPVWFNLGVPGRKHIASACFISSVGDSLDEIIAFQSTELNIFKSGSGSGANFSNLRSSYEKISAGSYTSGPIAFMRGLDQFAGAMKSGGATRNAAKIVVLDMDHPDILETRDGRPGFIKCKAVEEKRAHDLINIGYSSAYDDPNSAYKNVMYQNANHSVSIPDSFMMAVINDEEWFTKGRLTNEVIHKYKAKDLWKEISQAAWMCGDPGIQYTDTINRWHTVPNSGKIRSSNPCAEFLNIDDSACNLCGINLTKFFNDRDELRIDHFEHIIRVFVVSQDIIVDKASYPTEAITKNTHQLRSIGLNYGNLGALLMRLGHGYDSDEGRSIAARLASLMTGNAYLVSSKLAARRGAFPDFEKNRSEMLGIMKMHQEANANICDRWGIDKDLLGDDVVSRSAEVWSEVIRLGHKFGYSVSQATLQAPLGTTSFMMGMDTTGIEPAYSLVSYKSMVGGGQEILVNHTIHDALNRLGYSHNAVESIYEYVKDNGYIEGAPGLQQDHLPIFDCAAPTGPSMRYLSPMAHLEMMAAIQPLITCAQSKTINLPNNITAEEIANLYMEGWKLGIKCLALYRDGCKKSQPLETKQDKINNKTEIAPVYVTQRKPLPEDCNGSRHRFEIGECKGYVIMNEYPDGALGEVFLKLGKSGSTMNGFIDGFTQLLSIALQYGVPLDKLIRSFAHTKFDPSGFTKNSRIRFADSLYDYLFKLLDIKYFGGEITGLNKRSSDNVNSEESVEDASHEWSQSVRPPSMSMDAPPCAVCGSIMRRNGACYLCDSCGQSSGCS